MIKYLFSLVKISPMFWVLASQLEAVPDRDFEFLGGCLQEAAGLVVSAEGGCKEEETGLVWSSVANLLRTYKDAEEYCSKFKDGRWAKWELPRLKDVMRMVRLEIGEKYVGGPKVEPFVWVRDLPNVGVRTMASLTSTDSAPRDANEKAGVICVRQGVEKKLGCKKLESDYFITADGGCLYKKTLNAYSRKRDEGLPLDEAMQYCDDLREGGYGDWLLPELRDLKDIAWKGGSDAHFKFSVDGDFWTRTVEQKPGVWSETLRSSLLQADVYVHEFTEFITWVNLLTGKEGKAKASFSSYPIGKSNKYKWHSPPYSDRYWNDEKYDLSHLKAAVICVRSSAPKSTVARSFKPS